MSKKITVCISYYNQSDFLKKMVLNWLSYSQRTRDNFTFQIIDDHSREPATEVLKDIDLSGLDLHIYRVEEDLYCNIAGVRNLAAQECKTEWMFITDMDAWVTDEVSQEMLSLIDKAERHTFPAEFPSVAYKFNRKYGFEPPWSEKEKVHPAVCLIKREDYWKLGGCDEDLVGQYGGTDARFWSAAKRHGIVAVVLHDTYLVHCDDGCCKEIDRVCRAPYKRKHPPKSSPPKHIRFAWKKIH